MDVLFNTEKIFSVLYLFEFVTIMPKRGRNTSDTRQASNTFKRTKLIEFNKVLKIIIRHDKDNCVYVNLPSVYVKLGDYVFKTKPFDNNWMMPDPNNYIALNLEQYHDLKCYIMDNQIMASSFHTDVSEIEHLSVKLTSSCTMPINFSKEYLDHILIRMLDKEIVRPKQKINISFDKYYLSFTMLTLDDMVMGKITNKTIFDYEPDGEILIYGEEIQIEPSAIVAHLVECAYIDLDEISTESSNSRIVPDIYPIVVSAQELSDLLKENLTHHFFHNDIYRYDNQNIRYTFKIKIKNHTNLRYANRYCLIQNDDQIRVISQTHRASVFYTITTVDKLHFKIKALVGITYHPDDYIIHTKDLIQYIRQNIRHLIKDQSFIYCPNQKYGLVVGNLEPLSSDNVLYQLNPAKTKIFLESTSPIVFVSNRRPLIIDRISFVLKNITQKIKNDITLCQFNLTEFEKIIRQTVNKTAIGHEFIIEFGGGKCTLSVEHIDFVKKVPPNSDKCGKINDNTKMDFTMFENSTKKHLSGPVNEIVGSVAKLKNYLGGLSKELEEVVNIICLSRGKFRKEFKERGLKNEKGIILYGPPGTGKTTLARNLGMLLNCEGERFKFVCGPEIFSKWVGSSEKNIREIFKPAKEAWNQLGENSPTFMVVIDEIDAILPKRDESTHNPVRNSVVNQFLAEMDGLVFFDNLICIGITNRLELLDSAVIRSGRFGIHVKIDLPDANGRLEIFKIHSKMLSQHNKMSAIDFDQLVSLTDGYSGADIEQIVKMASMASLIRINELDDTNPELIQNVGMVTHDDFLQAIKNFQIKQKKNDEKHIFSMYI